jgi:hypothetical protein
MSGSYIQIASRCNVRRSSGYAEALAKPSNAKSTCCCGFDVIFYTSSGRNTVSRLLRRCRNN